MKPFIEMKTLSAYLCIAAALVVMSCGKEAATAGPAPESGLVPVTVEAAVPETRITLSDNVPVWDEGDRIGVFTTGLVLCPAFTAGEGGSSTTTFTGEKPEGSTLAAAFYPYDADATYSKSGITLDLPESQSGAAGKEGIMVATGNEGDGFVFSNVCCLVRMDLPAKLGLRKVELYREDRVSGPFTVEPSTVKVITGTPSTYLENRAEVSSSQTLSGEYVLAVLPSSSTKLEMALTDADGKVAFINTTFKTGKAYEAGRIKNLGTIGTLTFHDAALVADSADSQL